MGFYQTIHQQHGGEVVRLLKTWAKINIKLASLRNRKIFLLTCRTQGITPSHVINNTKNIETMIDIEDGHTGHKIKGFMLRLNSKIVNLEIASTHKNVTTCEKSKDIISEKLNSKIPNIFTDFQHRQNQTYNKQFNKIKKSNLNKINALKTKQTQHIFQTQDNWVKNLSGCDIPVEIKNFLALGFKFALPMSQRDISVKGLLAQVENIISSFSAIKKNVFRAKITNILTNYLNRSYSNTYLDILYNKTKAFFKNHPNLIITRSDKGNVTVIMETDTYNNQAEQILSDEKYYVLLQKDPTSTYQQKANRIVSSLKSKNMISENQARELTIYDQSSPKFYGLPKIHKPVLSLRPIISSIKSPNSKLASFVTRILTDAYDKNNAYYVTDTFDFAEFVNDKQLPTNHTLISLDVVSLFSNIPYYLIDKSIKQRWSNISNHTEIPQRDFLELIKFIFDTTYFQFNNKYYKQILGTPMGATLSPIISQYVMDDLLDSCIPKLSYQVPFLKKFVDDIVCSVPEKGVNEILSVFNSYDPNIQFTVEVEKDRSVPFLDTKLIRNPENKIILDWYIKPTSSGRYLNYNSHHTEKIKINLILALKHRVQRISHPTLKNKNLDKLLNILSNNGYPKKLLKKLLFNSNNYNNAQTSRGVDALTLPILNTNEEERTFYYSFPYIPEITHKISKNF